MVLYGRTQYTFPSFLRNPNPSVMYFTLTMYIDAQ